MAPSHAPKSETAKAPWNEEYYAAYGIGEGRTWDDARRFGCISAGGGTWYGRTLVQVQPCDHVWVNVPRTGYKQVRRDWATDPTAFFRGCGRGHLRLLCQLRSRFTRGREQASNARHQTGPGGDTPGAA